MPGWIVCANCGLDHRIPDRTFEPDSGGTRCPEGGARGYDAAHEGLEWHPDP
ncbi:hypothetical protein ACFQHN_17870 [Natrialbaceae archaeon GCM10025896]